MTKQYFWPIVFFIFAVIEYNSKEVMCGSFSITGQMWFMWLVMAAASFKLTRKL